MEVMCIETFKDIVGVSLDDFVYFSAGTGVRRY